MYSSKRQTFGAHSQTDGQSQWHRGQRRHLVRVSDFPFAHIVVHPCSSDNVLVIIVFFLRQAAVSCGDGIIGGGVGVRGLSNPKAGRGFREKHGGEQKSK